MQRSDTYLNLNLFNFQRVVLWIVVRQYRQNKTFFVLLYGSAENVYPCIPLAQADNVCARAAVLLSTTRTPSPPLFKGYRCMPESPCDIIAVQPWQQQEAQSQCSSSESPLCRDVVMLAVGPPVALFVLRVRCRVCRPQAKFFLFSFKVQLSVLPGRHVCICLHFLHTSRCVQLAFNNSTSVQVGLYKPEACRFLL